MDVTIEDGVDGGVLEDTILVHSPSQDNYNYGTLTIGQVRNYSAGDKQSELMQVDLSAYSGIIITAAHFGIDILTGGFDVSIAWNRVLKEWIEGTSNGSVNNGEPTWNSQKHNEILWGTSGCKADGTDRQTSADGSATVTGTSSDYHIDMTTVTVQAWIDNSANNHGIVIEAPNVIVNKYIQFRSSEAVSGNKPYFYMEYTEGVSGFPFFFGAGHY